MREIIATFLLVLATSACTATVDHIDIPYQEGTITSTIIKGAGDVRIQVVSKDSRSVLQVGDKGNGYSYNSAPILATNNLAKTFEDAIASELENAGFLIGDGGKIVEVELLQLYGDAGYKRWKNGSIATADGIVKVYVYDTNGSTIFEKKYNGYGTNSDVFFEDGDELQPALVRALSQTVSKVIKDQTLHTALLSTTSETLSVAPVAIPDTVIPVANLSRKATQLEPQPMEGVEFQSIPLHATYSGIRHRSDVQNCRLVARQKAKRAQKDSHLPLSQPQSGILGAFIIGFIEGAIRAKAYHDIADPAVTSCIVFLGYAQVAVSKTFGEAFSNAVFDDDAPLNTIDDLLTTPEGKFHLAWLRAKAEGTSLAYQTFLNTYPEKQYTAAATEFILKN